MRCDKCRSEALFFQSYSGRHLCGRHLALDIEARAKRSIRSHRWMSPGDHIAVPVSGDYKSAALLCFLKKLTADRRDIRLSAVPALTGDTGKGGRSTAMRVAESLGIPWIEFPGPGGSGTDGHEEVTKIAKAISLDDVAGGVLGRFLFSTVNRLVHSPPPGDGSRLPVICPFLAIPSGELDLYWEIEGTGTDLLPGRADRDTLSRETDTLLENYSLRHPSTKYALLHLAEQLSGAHAAATAAGGAGGPGAGEDNASPPQK